MSQSNNKNRYANIITTISLAAFLLLWSIVYNDLQNLEQRLRNVELTVTAISTRLGVGLAVRQGISQRRPGAALAGEPTLMGDTNTLYFFCAAEL